MNNSLYFQEVGGNPVVPIFRWQDISVFYERRVYKKFSTKSYEKYEFFLTSKGIIYVTIPRISGFFVMIIIILICLTSRLSIIITFNILKFSSNKKSSLFKKFLELHLLLGFLWEKGVRKLSLQFRLLNLICRSLFLLRFYKN